MVSPLSQPRVGEDKYAIGRFVVERARALGLSRSDLVERLRYDDIDRGENALSAALLTGMVAQHITNHLAKALEVDEALVGAVIAATVCQRRDESHLGHALGKFVDAV